MNATVAREFTRAGARMSLQNAAMYGRRARDSRSSEVLGDNVNRAIEQLNSAIEKLERRVRQLESKIVEK
jgi:polyhydroxyalkanoate synthesis regulator phasin